MEILKEAAPKTARIAVVWNRDDAGMTLRYREIEKSARTLNVEVQALACGNRQISAGLRGDDTAVAGRDVRGRGRSHDHESEAPARVCRDAAAFATYQFGFIVREGGLISYGPSADDELRRAADYIDRILKGAKPADLPAQQPTRYYLSINLKTAAGLGLTMPPSLLLRADSVVE